MFDIHVNVRVKFVQTNECNDYCKNCLCDSYGKVLNFIYVLVFNHEKLSRFMPFG